jgi:hypothetical protein
MAKALGGEACSVEEPAGILDLMNLARGLRVSRGTELPDRLRSLWKAEREQLETSCTNVLPTPALEPIPVDPHNRPETMKALKEEFQRRQIQCELA